MQRQLDSTVEADDLYHTAGQKGQAKGGGKKLLGRRARGRRKKREPGRGHYDKDRPAIIAWVSRQGSVVVQAAASGRLGAPVPESFGRWLEWQPAWELRWLSFQNSGQPAVYLYHITYK